MKRVRRVVGGCLGHAVGSSGFCTAVNTQVLRVSWYRFRATLRRRRRGYLALVLVIGLVGGLAMGAIAAARRTQSSFAVFRASTNPSDLLVALLDPRGYDA